MSMTTQKVVDETRRAESIKVLGFDPYEQEYQSRPITVITPAMAAYILKWHNDDNRNLYYRSSSF